MVRPVVIYGGVSGSALLALAQLPIRNHVLLMMCAEWLKIVVKYARGYELAADILWFYGLSFICPASHSLLVGKSDVKSRAMALMQIVWSSRLAMYLSHRPAAGAVTGNAYGGVTKKIGDELWLQLNYAFIAGLWRALTCVPLWLRQARINGSKDEICNNEEPGKQWSWVNLAGVGIWLTGMTVETIADLQKLEWVASSPGQFVNSGLWRHSRHPNYFGEILVWLGHFLVGVPYAKPVDWFVASLSPVFTYLLLTYVSGVPLVTLAAKKKWGKDPAFRDYLKKTPMLVPRPF